MSGPRLPERVPGRRAGLPAGRSWWRWSMAAGIALVVLTAVVGPLVAPHPAQKAVGMPFAEPGGDAVLGTDRLGRDVLSHLLTGGTQLLAVSAVIAVLVTVLSALLGAVAAVRPRAGSLIELGGDLVILLPAVLGILLILTAWPQGGVAALITVSLLFGVPYCARIFAAAAAGIAATGYVEAAVASGESLPHLVFREILPNLRAVFTTQLGLRFVVAVYLVSTVSFLGVPALSDDNWANMVRDNASGLLLNPWAVLAPSVAIAIVAVGVNLVVTGGAVERGTAGRGLACGVGGPAKPAPVTPTDDTADQVRAECPVGVEAVEVAPITGTRAPGAEGGRGVSGGDVESVPAGTVDSEIRRSKERGGGAAVAVVDAGDAAVVEGLTVVADNGVVVLAPLSFRLKAGTVTALTGASGAGKSTAMRALLGYVPAGMRWDGTVLVAGHEVFALDPGALRAFRRGRIAYVGQDPGSELNPLLRVRTLLAEAAPDATDTERRAMLELVGLDETHLRRRCGRLSGGQQRRLALARAFLRRPDVLVLDEPLAGLHGALRTDIARLIADLAVRESTAVLLSGHDTTTIHAIAHTVVEVHPPGGSPRLLAAEARDHSRASPEGPRNGSDDACAAVEEAGAGQDRPGTVGGAGRGVDAVAITGDDDARKGRVVALRVEGVTARADGQELLADVGFTVYEGQSLAVVGPSGAGKTTLARVVAGLRPANAGTLALRGEKVALDRRRRIEAAPKGIQLVTQNPLAALNPRRTVAQTLARPLRRIAEVPGAEIAARVAALLRAVELPVELADRHPHELSGGQRQRIALARALAADPAVLICDEITTALDAPTAAAIMRLLDRLRAEHDTAVVVISHDMALVAAHCAELLVLDHGRVVESGSTTAVLAAPEQQATAALLG
ncbi:ABC transporter ATP-binding protein/permease [Nocardia asteroides]|uniref:ABC transporter ATP-binding protein/permease n=1 Tax=Nocardia asteroides TaxID=1824 RepID=UPI003424F182